MSKEIKIKHLPKILQGICSVFGESNVLCEEERYAVGMAMRSMLQDVTALLYDNGHHTLGKRATAIQVLLVCHITGSPEMSISVFEEAHVMATRLLADYKNIRRATALLKQSKREKLE